MPVVEGDWYRPPPLTTWHWQLDGEPATDVVAQVYDVDLFDVPPALIQRLKVQGTKVICYFSAGTFEPNRPDSADFHPDDLGQPLTGWPEERWLDIRSPRVFEIMLGRVRLAKEKGCDGVEPDNVDAFDNEAGFALTGEDQLQFNRKLANAAHLEGMAIGLKNNLGQLEQLVDYYDFAVNEECDYYDECERLLTFTDRQKAVFHVEYARVLEFSTAAREELCARSITLGLSTLILPITLDGSYRFSCL
jgi:hypothetical protein